MPDIFYDERSGNAMLLLDLHGSPPSIPAPTDSGPNASPPTTAPAITFAVRNVGNTKMLRFDEIIKKAIDHNNIKLLSRLINKGYLDQFDKEGRYNPLFYAIDIGNTLVASYLIKNGAELIIEDAFSKNPFERAVYSCNPEIALLILEFSDYYRFPFAMWAGIELFD